MLIAFDGPSFSGKSFIAEKLCEKMPSKTCYVRGAGFDDTERSIRLHERMRRECSTQEQKQRYWNLAAIQRDKVLSDKIEEDPEKLYVADRSIFTIYAFDEKARETIHMNVTPDYLIYVDNDLNYLNKLKELRESRGDISEDDPMDINEIREEKELFEEVIADHERLLPGTKIVRITNNGRDVNEIISEIIVKTGIDIGQEGKEDELRNLNHEGSEFRSRMG